MAVVLDGVVEVAPRIHDAIDGSGIILNDDGYTPEEVENMVTILGSGKLPVTLSLEAE
jgi:preprotein translocase subunit SecD